MKRTRVCDRAHVGPFQLVSSLQLSFSSFWPLQKYAKMSLLQTLGGENWNRAVDAEHCSRLETRRLQSDWESSEKIIMQTHQTTAGLEKPQ